ncbi:alpha/beta hydrolase [Rhodococcus opacus]|uniref:alpha/beta hydrolase n=1 Tax=Rhodococcus opacus TaxID=37919 RepID=UPI00295361E9|nr:alpha/beta hydrolase [Rhodococcus opacus]MDV7088452.1 alpha/beta hydrolase [Rhodococcus opacus]
MSNTTESTALGRSNYLDLGGRRLHYCTAGTSGPTVLFEAGLGKSRTIWGLVQPEVEKLTRTVVYDRAGHGRSDESSEPRTLENLVSDHLALLAHLNQGPYILVGHSYGGPIVRTVASRVPDQVAGIVLVDESSEAAEGLMSRQYEMVTNFIYLTQVVLAKVGLLAPIVRRAYFRDFDGSIADESLQEDGTSRSARTARAECKYFVPGLQRLRDNPCQLPHVPVTTISANRRPAQDGQPNELTRSHAASVQSVPGAGQVSSELPNHYIQLREPQVVIREIEAIVQKVIAG